MKKILENAWAREGQEPGEMPRGMPWLVVIVTGFIAGWGTMYFLSETGPSAGYLGDRRTLSALGPQEKDDAEGGAGAPIYAARCSACHQSTGTGLSGVFPPLADSSWVQGDPLRPISIVLLGLQGQIEVKGETYAGVMPPMGGQMTDEEIAAVLTHVRSSFGNSADPVTAEQVAGQRAKLGTRDPIGGQAELVKLVP